MNISQPKKKKGLILSQPKNITTFMTRYNLKSRDNIRKIVVYDILEVRSVQPFSQSPKPVIYGYADYFLFG
jgi:hypothetical protein